MTEYTGLSTLARTVYGAAGMLLLIVAVFLLVNAFALRLGRRNALLCSAVTAAVLVTVQCLGEVSEAMKEGLPPTPMGSFAGRLPWALIALLLLALTAAETALLTDLIKKRHTMLTPDSVKECLDALPDGICFSASDGRPLLTNTRMNSLSAELFGTTVMNSELCRSRLSRGELLPGAELIRTEPTPLIRTADGTVWDLRRTTDLPGCAGVVETAAFDVTEQFMLNRELDSRNRALELVNERLRRYSREVEAMTREKELLSAKMRVHDDVGRALLAFRSYVVQPEDRRDRRELLSLWRSNIAVMENRAGTPSDADDLTLLRDAACAVGVRINVDGELPRDAVVRPVLILALHECLTNMVRHAGGDELRLALREDGGRITAEITNNGRPPEERIREKGGLADLRRSAELAGGSMEIDSEPVFRLRLTF